MKTPSLPMIAIFSLIALFITNSSLPLQAQETTALGTAEAAVAAAEAAAAEASSMADTAKDSKSFRREMEAKIKKAKDASAAAMAALKLLDNGTPKTDLNKRLGAADALLERVIAFVEGGYEGNSPQDEDKKKEKEKEKAEEAARKAAGGKPVNPIDPDKIVEGLKGGSFLPGGGDKPKDKDKVSAKADGLGPIKIAWKDFVELLKTVKEKVDGAGGVIEKGVKDFLDGKLKLPWFVMGTGETIGNVASLTVFNPLPVAVDITIPPTVLTSASGTYQPYIVPRATQFRVASGQTKTVLLNGICADPRKPPSTVANAGDAVLLDPDATDFLQTFKDQIAGAQRLEDAVDKMQKDGSITTPFSGDPEKERETVIQQTFWIYTAEQSGNPYTKEEFANKLYSQGGFEPPNDLTPPVPLPTTTVARTNPPSATSPDPVITPKTETSKTDAPPAGTTPAGAVAKPNPVVTKAGRIPTEAEKKKLDAGVDQFWDAFQLTGKEAKILD